jgi:hypothetical protein
MIDSFTESVNNSLLRFLKPFPKTNMKGESTTSGLAAIKKTMLPEHGPSTLSSIQLENQRAMKNATPLKKSLYTA